MGVAGFVYHMSMEQQSEGSRLFKSRIESTNSKVQVDIDSAVSDRAKELGITEESIEQSTQFAIKTVCELFGVLEEDLQFKGVEVIDFNAPKSRLEKLKHTIGIKNKYVDHKGMAYHMRTQKIGINLPEIDPKNDPNGDEGQDLESYIRRGLTHEFGHIASKVFVRGGNKIDTIQVEELSARVYLKELPALAAEHLVANTFLKTGEKTIEKILEDPVNRITYCKGGNTAPLMPHLQIFMVRAKV